VPIGDSHGRIIKMVWLEHRLRREQARGASIKGSARAPGPIGPHHPRDRRTLSTTM
jgi:hypothetical protein